MDLSVLMDQQCAAEKRYQAGGQACLIQLIHFSEVQIDPQDAQAVEVQEQLAQWTVVLYPKRKQSTEIQECLGVVVMEGVDELTNIFDLRMDSTLRFDYQDFNLARTEGHKLQMDLREDAQAVEVQEQLAQWTVVPYPKRKQSTEIRKCLGVVVMEGVDEFTNIFDLRSKSTLRFNYQHFKIEENSILNSKYKRFIVTPGKRVKRLHDAVNINKIAFGISHIGSIDVNSKLIEFRPYYFKESTAVFIDIFFHETLAIIQDSSNKRKLMDFILNQVEDDHEKIVKTVKTLLDEHRLTGEDNQCAAFCLEFDNRIEFSEEVFFPDFENDKHAEEKIYEYLRDARNRKDEMPKAIYVFSTNSPCLKRQGNMYTSSCMYRFLNLAHEYGVPICIAYNTSWGASGPNYHFDKETFDTVSSPNSDYNSDFQECQRIPFELNPKNLEESHSFSELYKKISESSRKQKLSKDISEVWRQMKTSAKSVQKRLYEQHVNIGEEIINSFTFLPEVYDEICRILRKIWLTFIQKGFMTFLRGQLTDKYNPGIVRFFKWRLKSVLGADCLLRLYDMSDYLSSPGIMPD